MRTLSKSDFKLARTCVTKLYYAELGYPRLTDFDPYLEMLAQGGYMVEYLAKAHFPDGIALHYDRADPVASARETMEHLRRDEVTLFEATILSGHKLARIDILRKRGRHFELIEVKSKSFSDECNDDGSRKTFRSTRKPYGVRSEWRPYLEDVAFQVDLLRQLVPDAVVVPYLMMPDRQRTTSIEGLPRMFTLRREVTRGREREVVVGFSGDAEAVQRDRLLAKVDVSDDVESLLGEVRSEADRFEALLAGDTPIREQQPISWHCRDCEFREHHADSRSGYRECWGALALPDPHLFDLWKFGSTRIDGRPVADLLIERGRTSLFDVRADMLVTSKGEPTKASGRQLVQIAHSRSGTQWIGPGMGAALSALRFPLHFIDFETSQLAVPYHAGMRPYEKVAFEWSCHAIDRPGAAPRHAEWLNTEDTWPNEKFARSLREAIGDEGAVLTWSPYEENILRQVRDQLDRYQRGDDALRAWLDATLERVVDLHRICVADFFHPGMRGRTSIKVVLDALWGADDEMHRRFVEWGGGEPVAGRSPYAALPPIEIDGRTLAVADGTGAMEAYTAMLYGLERDNSAIRAAWGTLLRRYCRLDTLAMVLVWDYWTRQSA